MLEINYLMKNLEETLELNSKKFYWRINLPILERNQYRILDFPLVSCPSFTKPSLFIGGTNSHRLHLEYRPSVKNLFPKSQIVMLEAGHFVHAEKPSTVSHEISKFLDENHDYPCH